MRGKERNDAFFSNQKPKQTVSLQSRFKAARAQGSLNMSSCSPPLTAIPVEVFDLEKFIEEGEKFWEFEPLKSLDFSFNKISVVPDEVANLIDCTSMKFRDNQIGVIPEGLYEGCISLRHLDFGSNRLTSLSDRILNLASLKDLLLSNNSLSGVPPELMDCQAIITLDLDHNRIRELPDHRWRLNSLVTLNVAHNQLQSLPDSLGSVVTLEVLNCGSNHISKLPDMSKLTALRILDASQNALSKFPLLPTENSKHMLSHLILGYNRIAVIDIGVLLHHRNLSELLLHNNQLQEVPAEIEYVASLKIIDVSNNNLRDLPATLGYMPALQHIRAEGNPIKVIRQQVIVKGGNELKAHLRSRGESLLQAAQLESAAEVAAVARLASEAGTGADKGVHDHSAPAPFASAPGAAARGGGTAGREGRIATGAIVRQPNSATIAAAQAQVADRIHYRIRDITGSTLDLSALSLTALPADLPHRVLAVPLGPTLLTVNLTNNLLTVLPVELQALSSVKALCLVGNKLGAAHEVVSVLALPQLTSLDVSKNEFTAQSLQMLIRDASARPSQHSLAELVANNNPLRVVPAEVAWHRGLRTLRLSYCQLTTIDTLDLYALPSLQNLDVSNNKITTLPSSLLSLINLEYLNAENNDLRDVPVELGALPKLKVLLIAGNPQRTVRTNVLQQGSTKIIEYLKSRIPAADPVHNCVGARAGAVAHSSERWTDAAADRADDRWGAREPEPPRRTPYTSAPPPAAPVSASTQSAPGRSAHMASAAMRAEMDYQTGNSTYRAHERQVYTARRPEDSHQGQALAAYQPQPRPRRVPESAPESDTGARGSSSSTAFQAPVTSRHARAGNGASSVGSLLGGGEDSDRTTFRGGGADQSNVRRGRGSLPY
jgi:Leucine-rich repeat (LRR) protein